MKIGKYDKLWCFFLSLESQLLNIYLHTTDYDWRFLEVLLKIAFEEQWTLKSYYIAEEMS